MSTPQPAYCLTFAWRGRTREIVLFPGGRAFIGRAAHADIPVGDRTVDRVHALIEWTPNGPDIRDLGTVNGTALNGQPLGMGRPVRLIEGDEIRVGATVVKLERCGRPEAPARLHRWGRIGRFCLDCKMTLAEAMTAGPCPGPVPAAEPAPKLLPVNLDETSVRAAAWLLCAGLEARTRDGGRDIPAALACAWNALSVLCPAAAERL